MDQYLVSAKVPGGLDSKTKDHSRPGEITSDRVSEDVEGVCARSVALFTDVHTYHWWDRSHVSVFEVLIASYLIKRWKKTVDVESSKHWAVSKVFRLQNREQTYQSL